MGYPDDFNGCLECSGSARPGYILVRVPFPGTSLTVPGWKRCPARCWAWSRDRALDAARKDAAEREAAEKAAAEEAAAQQPATAPPAVHPAAPRPTPAYRGKPRPTAAGQPPRPSGERPRRTSAHQPALAIDAADGTWAIDLPDVPGPAGPKAADCMAWLGTGLPLQVERIHPDGRDVDGFVCLSAAAMKVFGLPADFPAKDAARTTAQGKLAKLAAAVGMEVSEELGPTVRLFRRSGAPGGPKTSMVLVLVPWLGQGTDKHLAVTRMLLDLATAPDRTLNAATLARRIRTFTKDLGVAPGATAASTSMLLLDAVRPRFQWSDDEPGKRVLREGALPGGDLCVPPAYGSRHPLTKAQRADGIAVCEEEDFKYWARPLTDDEATRPWCVALDVCASYLSVTETLPLPAGPLEHRPDAAFDKRVAGLWWCDFTTVTITDPLPHPATHHGMPPTGGGWYCTVTVEYMRSAYGFDTSTITDAYLSSHTVPFLKEWTTRIRTAYKRVFAVLGLDDAMDADAFLQAYLDHKDIDPDDTERWDALVLSKQYKMIYKGGIGKWADKSKYLDEDDWLETIVTSWQYRPEIRHTIVAAARIAEHRRMRKTYLNTGLAPFSVNVDSLMYAVEVPTPHVVLTYTPKGAPEPGTVRMGIAAGSHKHEATVPTIAVTTVMDAGDHPARLNADYTITGDRIPDDAQEDAQ